MSRCDLSRPSDVTITPHIEGRKGTSVSHDGDKNMNSNLFHIKGIDTSYDENNNDPNYNYISSIIINN